MYRNKSLKRWQRLLCFALVVAFVLMQSIPAAVASAAGAGEEESELNRTLPKIGIQVYNVPDNATNVTVKVKGVDKDCDEHGNHWTADDDGWYTTDDINSVTVVFGSKSVVVPRSELTIGMDECTIKVTLKCSYKIDTDVTHGTITPDVAGIHLGEDKTISYSAATGFHLASVTVDGDPVDITAHPSSYTFPFIHENHCIKVVYEADPTFTIDTSVTGGSISPDESGIAQGASRTISYSPNTGYHLDSVMIDGSDATASNPQSVTFEDIDADHTVVVKYAIDKFNIKTTVTGGTITDSESNIPYGEDRTVTYSANTGFHLLSVTVDNQDVTGTNPGSVTFEDITANHEVVVVYEADPTFAIDTDVTGGSITADETGIPQGASRTITYSADEGQHLVSVTVDGQDVTATNPESYAFYEINANHTVVVVYAPDIFKICTSVENGTITDTMTDVPYGATRTISYSPKTGFHLVSVKVDGQSVSIAENPDSYTFKDIKADHKIEVAYCVNTYAVCTKVVNGQITPGLPAIPYGSPFAVVYAPNPGFYLASVKVDGVPQNISQWPFFFAYYFDHVTANHLVEVVYAPVTFTVDTEVAGGTITADEANIPFGADRTVTYSPNLGYHLVSVTVDGEAVDIAAHPGSYTFECIKSNHAISVVYEIDKFSIDTTVTNGAITSDEAGIPYGSERTITYNPSTGYHLASVTVDGVAVDIATYPSSYTFASVIANHTVIVVFEINTYTIDTSVTNGTITADESGITYGSNRTITYDANDGYILRSVTVDGVEVDITVNPSTYTFSSINANHTVAVVYDYNDVPDTGDQTNIPLYVAMMALSLAGAALTFGKARAQKEKSK